jgi:Fe-S-cluster containining protein
MSEGQHSSRRLPILPAQPMAPMADPEALPTVRALAALWDEVRQRPLWAPPNFWRYVALRRRLSLRLLRPEDVAIVSPPGKVNDCTACTDLCCTGPRATVLLRLRDIAVLMDIGRTELITHAKPQFTAAELQARPALRRQVASAAWKKFPVLAQNHFGACRALTDAGLCSLYPHWPLTCARFPYALHVDTAQVVYAARCRAFYIHPQRRSAVSTMQRAAVAAYNERIKDMILLAYAPKRLFNLGIMPYLREQTYISG